MTDAPDARLLERSFHHKHFHGAAPGTNSKPSFQLSGISCDVILNLPRREW